MRTTVDLPLVPVTATIGMRLRARGEEVGDHRLGHVTRRAFGRLQVHAEAGRGVDLDDAAAGLAHRAGDVGGDEVDAGHVQAHGQGRAPGDAGVVGMDDVGAVDRRAAGREVGRGPQGDDGALVGRRVDGQADARQHLMDMIVDDDSGHHLLVPDAASGVLVHRSINCATLERPSPVTRAGTRSATATTWPPDHQNPVVAADILLFDDDPAAMLDGLLEAPAHLIRRDQAQVDAAAVIAVERLEHDRALMRSALARPRQRCGRPRRAGRARRPPTASTWSAPCCRRSRRRCARCRR
jgi:hypothetical protein